MKAKILHWSCLLVLLVVLTACSGRSRNSEILEAVPSDMDGVMVGDMEQMLRSAGGQIEGCAVTFPAYFTEHLPAARKNWLAGLTDFLKKSGINAGSVAMAARLNSVFGNLLIFRIDRMEDFVREVNEAGYHPWQTEGDIRSYLCTNYSPDYRMENNTYDLLVTQGEYGYWTIGIPAASRQTVWEEIKEELRGLEERSVAETAFAPTLTEGNVFGCFFRIPPVFRTKLEESGVPPEMAGLFEGIIGVKGDLTQNTASLRFQWLDDEGNPKDLSPFSKYLDCDATIDSDLYTFLPKEENLVCAAAFRNADWDACLPLLSVLLPWEKAEAALADLIVTCLRRTDGTVACGIGYESGIRSVLRKQYLTDYDDAFYFTLLCQLRKGESEALLGDLRKLAGVYGVEGMRLRETSDGMEITLPYPAEVFRIQIQNGVLLLSTCPLAEDGEMPLERPDFDGELAAAGVYIPREQFKADARRQENDAEVQAVLHPRNAELEVRFSLTGEEPMPFFEKFFRSFQTLTYQKIKLLRQADQETRENFGCGLDYSKEFYFWEPCDSLFDQF